MLVMLSCVDTDITDHLSIKQGTYSRCDVDQNIKTCSFLFKLELLVGIVIVVNMS